jgi:tetratricopeptide (TPR) repeat protein
MAAELFRQAIALDPTFADAHAGLGSALKRMTVVADRRPNMVFPDARRAAERALALQDNHPEAKSVLGTVEFWHDWNYPKAIDLLRQAKALQPSDPDHQLFLAHVYSNTGMADAALREIRLARSWAPGWPLPRALEGEFLMHAGDFTGALAQLDAVIESHPTFWLAHLFRAFALPAKQRYQETLDAADRIIKLRQEMAPKPVPPYSYAIALKGYAFAKLGQSAEAKAMLDELEAQAGKDYVPASRIALVYYALDDEEKAIERLNEALTQRDVLLTFLGVSSLWDEWRDKPRFQQILKSVSLLDVSEQVRKSRGK